MFAVDNSSQLFCTSHPLTPTTHLTLNRSSQPVGDSSRPRRAPASQKDTPASPETMATSQAESKGWNPGWTLGILAFLHPTPNSSHLLPQTSRLQPAKKLQPARMNLQPASPRVVKLHEVFSNKCGLYFNPRFCVNSDPHEFYA